MAVVDDQTTIYFSTKTTKKGTGLRLKKSPSKPSPAKAGQLGPWAPDVKRPSIFPAALRSICGNPRGGFPLRFPLRPKHGYSPKTTNNRQETLIGLELGLASHLGIFFLGP